MCFFFFFFKQKTAYEMRISDWSSDVCSSDLARTASPPSARARCRRSSAGISCTQGTHQVAQKLTSNTCPRKSAKAVAAPSRVWNGTLGAGTGGSEKVKLRPNGPSGAGEIGRASGRERGCQYG